MSAKILVVDDNPTNLKLASDVLAFEGHDILKAVDAEEAQIVLADTLPDLILMDIALPGMDGLTLAFKSGVIGTLAAGWVDIEVPVKLIISGTQGHAVIYNDHLFYRRDKLPGSDSRVSVKHLPPGPKAPIQQFFDVVAGSRLEPLVTPPEAASRGVVMQAIYQGTMSESGLTFPSWNNSGCEAGTMQLVAARQARVAATPASQRVLATPRRLFPAHQTSRPSPSRLPILHRGVSWSRRRSYSWFQKYISRGKPSSVGQERV